MESMDGDMDKIDRISDLPDFILHNILSLLLRKDANRACVLSKRWKFIWDTFPIFDFDQYIYIEDSPQITPKYMEQTRELTNHVDKSLRKFTRHKLLMERLDLNMPLIDHNYVSIVDEWIALSLDSGVREMSVMVDPCSIDDNNHVDDNNLVYIVPETAFVAKSTSRSSRFNRLEKLSLAWVHISKDVIQNIIRHCPNLNYLHLANFRGLKTLEISELDKLETVSIISTGYLRDLERVNIDAPNLKHLHFDTHGRRCGINMTSCHDLKELRLNGCEITDDLLSLYLSRFPLLEILDITNCRLLRNVEISAQRLRSLQLYFGSTNIETIQIDAPTLSFFNYTTHNMPALISENVPCPMKIAHVINRKVADNSWFSELRKFLGRSTQRKIFTLEFIESEVSFDLEELGEGEIPPFVEVDHLKLNSFFISTSVDCVALINGLLWSCHPKIISIPSNSLFQKDCIKVLCEKLLDRGHPSCCDFSRVKCWRHHLKQAKIERFGGIEDERLLHSNLLLDTLPSLEKKQEVCFKLEWDF